MEYNKEKNSTGVFMSAIGMSKSNNTIDSFIAESLKSKDPRMVKAVEAYKKDTDKLQKSMERLANRETLILQIRSLNSVKNNMTFYLLHDKFIYARSVFMRPDKQKNDIRVLVDQLKNHPKSTYESLIKNRNVRKTAMDKLVEVMEKEIELTLEKIKLS